VKLGHRRGGGRLGVNVEETRRLARAVKIPVIASGGVATLEDIRRLKEVEKDGVEGVIVGRALYAGLFKLSEARIISTTNL
jgi:phosphoribosylformimino-5-aminoimidazole carboxamide ribotide isomerase